MNVLITLKSRFNRFKFLWAIELAATPESMAGVLRRTEELSRVTCMDVVVDYTEIDTR